MSSKSNRLKAASRFEQARQLHEAGDLVGAIRHYGFALALDRTLPDARMLRGIALAQNGELAAALDTFDRILLASPHSVDAWNNRGNVLLDLGEHAAAAVAYGRAIAVQPDFPSGHYHRGIARLRAGELRLAIADFDRALQLSPGLHDARKNRGIARLLMGDLEQGFADFEARRLSDEVFPFSRFPGPSLGPSDPVSGKTVYVYTDGGLGDVFQFARYLPPLANAGARVTFAVNARLHRLIATAGLDAELIDGDADPGPFDYSGPLMSLPFALRPIMPGIPQQIVLRPEPELVAKWRARLGDGGLKVGIGWQGRVSDVDRGRSLPLVEFAPLADIPGLRLISLQKGFGSEQMVNTPWLEQLGSDLDDAGHAFVDTAAVIESLDLVITSDTALGHLAGSLGKPVWMILQHIPDWRWFLEREDSPWYPSARLFRQATPGDWAGVIGQVRNELRARA